MFSKVSLSSCPPQGMSSFDYIWTYIHHALFSEQRNTNFGDQKEMIKAMFLRSKNTGRGGNVEDAKKVAYTLLGPEQYRHIESRAEAVPENVSTVSFHGSYFESVPLPTKVGKYVLSHAYLYFEGKNSGKPFKHAITGYACDKNKWYVYDSNLYKTSYPINWRSSPEKVAAFLTKKYNNVVKIPVTNLVFDPKKSLFFYMKEDISTYRFPTNQNMSNALRVSNAMNRMRAANKKENLDALYRSTISQLVSGKRFPALEKYYQERSDRHLMQRLNRTFRIQQLPDLSEAYSQSAQRKLKRHKDALLHPVLERIRQAKGPEVNTILSEIEQQNMYTRKVAMEALQTKLREMRKRKLRTSRIRPEKVRKVRNGNNTGRGSFYEKVSELSMVGRF